MSRHEHQSDRAAATSRRSLLRGAGVLAGGTVLAGCLGDGEENADDGEEGADDGEPAAGPSDDSGSADDASGDDAAAGDGSYTVSIAPVGEVTFEEPPETVFTRLTHHADMAFALGRGDQITAMHAPEYYDGLWNQFVERLPGVSLDWSGLYSSWQPSKEKLYDLDSDLHLADPAWITQQDAWDREDVEEIGSTVGPWFGNSLSDTHQEPTEEWADDYEYYGLWEQFELVAEAFRERERYEALAAVHDDLQARLRDGLPEEGERPSAVMIAAADIEEIYAYRLDQPGFLTAHTAPLGAHDAFEGDVESASIVDYEQLLEADPDVILHLGGMEPNTDIAKRRETFESDPVASEITAVQEGRVYAQGARYQGPILHLFQLEMTAKQLYPDAFGEWPTYEEGPYPELPPDEQLFDRQRVADAILGDV